MNYLGGDYLHRFAVEFVIVAVKVYIVLVVVPAARSASRIERHISQLARRPLTVEGVEGEQLGTPGGGHGASVGGAVYSG